ncbi:MAG: hypothetical protein COW24_04125 [Candidatus Kerfeldbacteria bacterium CG15_BIG_FIL_POST_REV_8_21_14_020_45_12]|uniref:Ribosomal RNA large subunit methyltransferase H n=1 Tax=Candidatus Kerfeldbacteria bacterium CG15_BIG_FIL_POST_REV_8_21_14_020_45_12 TaxID=2014247 RepID=A0A2M7H3B9_9BACT|nr:MAG: hypothetical protein COW24_04125 [Candidatus Kerfeldbacteria bacterium CG15_BIG_FIL_POST_REV_8_21_14_020_45_12]PJA93125.1 MAG: hypothetical protein CO132_04460 [Candidatus Kerfeldbacteria bacterium CG_4_9_14_3_um_filter_45_8]
MHITILSVGKTRSRELLTLEDEYAGRIRGRFTCNRTYLKNDKELMSAIIKTKGLVTLLDEHGSLMNSREFATYLDKKSSLTSDFTMVVGDAAGLPAAARDYATDIIALSEMTFPHELARVLLLEQIYRAQTLIEGHPYHKD